MWGKSYLYKPGQYDRIAAIANNRTGNRSWFRDFFFVLSDDPWRFASPAHGLMHISAMLFSHCHVSRTVDWQEEDINGDFCSALAATVYAIKGSAPRLPNGTGRHFFYAARGRYESKQGADFGIVAHLHDEEGDLFRPLLFQGKISSRKVGRRWSANLHRKDSSGKEQIDKILPSGIGWYVFYHQDSQLPLPGPTVRSAADLGKAIQTSWTVDTFEPAVDFAAFLIFDVLDPQSSSHLSYRDAKTAIQRLVEHGSTATKCLR